jgi:hypothetical protein
MKKATVISALMLTCLTVFDSCKKLEDTAISSTQTNVAVALKANQSYTYALPAPFGKQTCLISQRSVNNAATIITADASGNMQLVYIPALNYIGTDVVALTINSEDGIKGNRPQHHPENKGEHHPKLRLPFRNKKCDKQDKPTESNILINFSITSDETISTINK